MIASRNNMDEGFHLIPPIQTKHKSSAAQQQTHDSVNSGGKKNSGVGVSDRKFNILPKNVANNLVMLFGLVTVGFGTFGIATAAALYPDIVARKISEISFSTKSFSGMTANVSGVAEIVKNSFDSFATSGQTLILKISSADFDFSSLSFGDFKINVADSRIRTVDLGSLNEFSIDLPNTDLNIEISDARLRNAFALSLPRVSDFRIEASDSVLRNEISFAGLPNVSDLVPNFDDLSISFSDSLVRNAVTLNAAAIETVASADTELGFWGRVSCSVKSWFGIEPASCNQSELDNVATDSGDSKTSLIASTTPVQNPIVRNVPPTQTTAPVTASNSNSANVVNNYFSNPTYLPQTVVKADTSEFIRAIEVLRAEFNAYKNFNSTQNERIFTRIGKASEDDSDSSTTDLSTIDGSTITNSSFSGSITASSFVSNAALQLNDITPPADTTSLLYNDGGSLYWNGSVIGGSVGSWSTSGSDVYRTSGNVGIGTSSPYARLSVVGQVVGSYFTSTSTTASTFPYASTTALTVSGTAFIGSLNGPLQANGGLVSATTSVGVNYGGTGLTSAPSYGNVLVGNSSGGYTLTATSSIGITSSQWTTSGSSVYYSTGNVGIGTSTPTYDLGIQNAGSASIGIKGGTNADIWFERGTSAYGAGLVYRTGGTSNWTIGLRGSDSGYSIYDEAGGATRMYVSTSGNVGIGTTSPWRALSVKGSSDLGANALAGYFTATTSTASTFPYASTTALSATTICLTSDCRSTWSDKTGTIFSSTTLAYFSRIGTVPSDAYRVDQFFRALEAAGLYDDLVDGALLRSNQNVESTTTLKSITGASATITGTPRIGPEGLYTDGTDDYVYWDVTATTAGTVAETFKGVITGQTSSGALWSLQNSTGVGTGAGTSGWHLIFNTTSTAYVFSGNGSSVAVTSGITDPVSSSATTIHYNNPYEQINIVTNDNASSPTIKAYVDGRLALNDSSGNVQTSASLNRFIIGARSYTAGAGGVQSYSRGTHSVWLLFNRDLTADEASALTAAMRWLEPKTKNVVYLGDSTSAYLSTKPSDAWTYQHSILKAQSNARIYNVAINGQSASYFNTNYDTLVYPFRPGINGVQEADIYIWLGINDLNGGSTDSSVYTSLKSIWAKAKRDGFRVFVGTLMPGTSYTSGMETYRQALNTSILSDPSLYDSVFRPDRLLIDPYDNTYYLDGFHLTTYGNTVISNMINDDKSIATTTYFTNASTSLLSVKNWFSVGTTTSVDGALFNVGSSTSTFLNVMGVSGYVGIGTSSPYSRLSVAGQVVAQNFVATSSTASVFPYASTTAITSSSLFLGNSSFSSTYSAPLVIGVDGAGTGFQIGVSSTEYTKFVSGGSYKGMLGTGSLPLVIGSEGDVQFTNNFGPGFGERMMIKSSGNVGIGTTSPYSKLAVAGEVVAQHFTATSTTATSSVMLFSVGSTTPNGPSIFSVGTTSPSLSVNRNNGFVGIGTTSPIDLLNIRPAIMSSGSELLTLGRMGCSSGFMGLAVGALGGNGCANYSFISDGSSSYFNAPSATGAVIFRVQNTTRAQLTAAGRLGIGTTTPNNMLDVYSTSKAAIGFTGASGDKYKWTVGMDVTNSGRFAISSSTALGTSDRLVIDGNGNTGIATTSPWRTLSVVGTMAINGLTAAATTADALCLDGTTKEVLVNTGAATCTVSSNRFKHDIQALDSSLDKVLKLRPVSYIYNGSEEYRVGFVAEDVDLIDPRFVFREESGIPRGVRYEDLVALLTKAVQEQNDRIVKLDNSVQSVVTKMDELVALLGNATGTPALSSNALGESLVERIKMSIASSTDWAVSKITASFARVEKIDVDVITVNKGIELKDSVTGDVYCLTVRDGRLKHDKGTCTESDQEAQVENDDKGNLNNDKDANDARDTKDEDAPQVNENGDGNDKVGEDERGNNDKLPKDDKVEVEQIKAETPAPHADDQKPDKAEEPATPEQDKPASPEDKPANESPNTPAPEAEAAPEPAPAPAADSN